MTTRPNENRAVGPDRTGGVFDVVIVGGGSAGAVLARRLSENPARNVLLLEAGEAYAPDGYPDVIANADRVGGDAEHDWGFEGEAGPLGRMIHVPRGKVLGGSSGVNAAVAIRTFQRLRPTSPRSCWPSTSTDAHKSPQARNLSWRLSVEADAPIDRPLG